MQSARAARGLTEEAAVAEEQSRQRMRIALVVSFLNEAEHLPRLLASLVAQTEPPDELLLVDDGSSDESAGLAEAFAAEHEYARALHRPARASRGGAASHGREVDRLVDAPELKAFSWGVEQLSPGWDIVTKLDGDLELPPTLLADVRSAFTEEPELGITGSYLSVVKPDGSQIREQHPPYHVRGPNKFYRRECFAQITPLPAFLGWDTIDDLRARRLGWSTRSFQSVAGDGLHLRPTGAHDGRLRAFRRWGRCAWGFGAHPAWVALGAGRRMRSRPYVFGGLSYLQGYLLAGLRGYPRAEPELLAYRRAEDLGRLRLAVRRALSVLRAR